MSSRISRPLELATVLLLLLLTDTAPHIVVALQRTLTNIVSEKDAACTLSTQIYHYVFSDAGRHKHQEAMWAQAMAD